MIEKYVKKGNPLHIIGHITYRTWTDSNNAKHTHTAIVIDSFTLLGRPAVHANESSPDLDDPDTTVAVEAEQGSELSDDAPF